MPPVSLFVLASPRARGPWGDLGDAPGQLFGLTSVTVYSPCAPGFGTSVNSTWSPGFTFKRLTFGATAKSIVIAGHLIAGIGPWLRFTVCLAVSTFFTVPVA